MSHASDMRLWPRLALFAAAATLLFLFERALPNPLPFFRLGLANVVTLIVLLAHGFRAAAWVLLLRLLLGGFFAGTLLGPQFLLATAGSAASLVVMAVAAQFGARIWSPLGISVLGATTHAVAQLVVVAALFAAGQGVFLLLPLFVGMALLTGTCTGVVADIVLARLDLATRTAPERSP
ncbi:MAG: Gx transporter family protein [Candidatus Latescibacterota bacterium]|nr:MAG: Gx transporter family protein [Candidatus Latescibacterota bacterium]